MIDTQQTLYERVGGEPAVTELVHDFYDRVLADPELQPFFEQTSLDKLHRMQREFFSAAMDGPITYSGRPLSHVHHGRGITRHHFGLYVGHLLDTLKTRGIDDQDVQDILGRISTYTNDIIGGVGSAG
ncbi:Cyanoglobin; Hemoglobin-like protein HbN [Olavius algarvensis associated proteobacterium Delta 3]|nr:Cyanoglobin; Hemoglobin-like protein HbN [Olavius algarvensis associated proteobacterium Delta 3]CAB5147836.1 Cyanoglobin; Hemoglobin-like protein HbN [Olavius algarvensis associated proteobacterium Delta 3]